MSSTEMGLNEFLKTRYTQKLQEVIQEFIHDVGRGPKDLGIVGTTSLSVALDFVHQVPSIVGNQIAEKDYAKYLDDLETIIKTRFEKIRAEYGQRHNLLRLAGDKKDAPKLP